MSDRPRLAAVLGPTNTGKTHYAIDRMLGYRTGMIGLPLRLLAREVYDKIVAARGPSVVALVTGEERIVPPRAAYWVCTVEAMPEGMGCDFVAIDEIQLCADPERGHVFTDRLLRARGLRETLFLGADTMRGPIAGLVPGVEFVRRERMSQLSYTGSKKISRLAPRSAIVGFSVENVYAIAELLRRQKGGAAVVMGALSPRTRNAQVALYQNGEVDYLVATDAIGMGLNLDIDHVAFSSLTKFDGRRMRPLAPNELAQIAGRAGRGMANGTFGVTGEAQPLDDEVAEAIVSHRFAPIRRLNWRNAALSFGSVERLIASLEAAPDDDRLARARDADDLIALRMLAQDGEVMARASDPRSVQLLWDVCRVPDFRGISHAEHAGLLNVIFAHLHQRGSVPDDFIARQVHRIDRTDGDIDTLSKRLAYIRTWTYVAQRKGWVGDETHWRETTRAVEDRLSDALHDRLTQRFVDRRTSVLLRRLKQKEALLAEVNDKGEVTVEGEFVGRLEGFRFRQDKDAQGQEAKTLKSASLQALAPHFHLRADRFYNAPDTEIDFTEQGGLMWGDQAVGKLVAGDDPLKPRVTAFVDDTAGADVIQKVERRLQHFIDRKIAALFEPLMNIRRDETLSGTAKGFGYRMVESMGVIPRAQVSDEVRGLDQEARGALRKHGIRFGQFTVFMPLLLKPAPTRLRLVLWSLANGLDTFPEAPPPGLVTVPDQPEVPAEQFAVMGYRKSGARAIRIDMLERLADMLRGEDSRGGFEAKADMLSITGLTLEQFADLMQGLGYRAEKGEREKARPVDRTIPVETLAPETGGGDPRAETPVDTVGGEDTLDPADDTLSPADDTAEPDAPDQPVFDAAAEADAAPGAITEQPQVDPESTVEAEAESIPEDDLAPVAEAPAEPDPEVDTGIAEIPSDEVPVGTPPDTDLAAPEVETYYTFTWAGTRGGKGGRRGGAEGGARGERRGGGGGEKRGGKAAGGPRGKSGGAPGGKRPPREDKGPKTYESRPQKKDRIDPDNPFAAALMGFKDRS
ncbi:helicase-related protein [Roseivivax isoporae]|uniref:Disulfide oxidoreductase n=1 Tax=Roseivivax isoporae LMG 25204 TaxID=1449351 RepID=X7F975_9RHOB|nr:helicase-related protein [Roseivivax isoporae]ETX29278.1 disulfide oxidoreductase [Roseivivax isoporae LMG 25204]